MPVLHVEITRMLLMPFNVGEHMNYKETTFEADLRFESVYVQKAYACVPMGLARQSLDARAGSPCLELDLRFMKDYAGLIPFPGRSGIASVLFREPSQLQECHDSDTFAQVTELPVPACQRHLTLSLLRRRSNCPKLPDFLGTLVNTCPAYSGEQVIGGSVTMQLMSLHLMLMSLQVPTMPTNPATF
eukprot:s4485_g3.t1